mgnify:CR=1
MARNLKPRAKFLAREEDGTVWAIGYLRYPRRSVLAGRETYVRVRAFDSMDEARAVYPRLPIEDMVDFAPSGYPDHV